MTMRFPLSKAGAALFVLWGILHVFAGGSFLMAAAGPDATLPSWDGSAAAPAGAAGPYLAQHGFNLLWAGLFAAVVGAWLNWRNSRVGYWANLAVVSLFDIGFVVFVLAPGHIPLEAGILGPILWLAAVAFATAGYLREPEGAPAAKGGAGRATA